MEKYNCEVEGCDNNKGQGFKNPQALKLHCRYKHSEEKKEDVAEVQQEDQLPDLEEEVRPEKTVVERQWCDICNADLGLEGDSLPKFCPGCGAKFNEGE